MTATSHLTLIDHLVFNTKVLPGIMTSQFVLEFYGAVSTKGQRIW